MEKIVINSKDTLGVIDMQVDFFFKKGGKLYVGGAKGEACAEEVLCNIKKLARYPFGFIFTSEDDHPLNHCEHEIFPEPHCVSGTEGQLFVNLLEDLYAEAQMNLVKGQNQYIISYTIATSPMFPLLVQKMKLGGVKRIFIAGLAYDYCVGESAVDLVGQGFEVYVVRDATRSVAPEHGGRTAMMDELLKLKGIKICYMADFT
jgi:nicotinamidase/pyrazinamidase